MKEWSRVHFGDIQRRIKDTVVELNALDIKEEALPLTDGEKQRIIELQDIFWLVSRQNESLLMQKSRSKWLLEGDTNSKYFHSLINWEEEEELFKRPLCGWHMD